MKIFLGSRRRRSRRNCHWRHRIEPRLRLGVNDGMLASTLDLDLDIAALQFELGNVLLDQKLYKFFQFFLIHSYMVGPLAYPWRAFDGRANKPGADHARLKLSD